MAHQKVTTIMVLKVDLGCSCCFKKVKKLLCQFPHIKDQIYNEKQNTVTIRVWCCSPEKIREKLICKGGKSIKSIEIVKPGPPPPPPSQKPADPKPKETPPPSPAAAPPADPKPPPPIPPPADPNPPPPVVVVAPPTPMPSPPPAKPPEPPKQPEPAPIPIPTPVQHPEPVRCYPVYPGNTCCSECYEGRTTGPCYRGFGYGVPPPPPPAGGGWCCYEDGWPPPPPPPGGCGYNNYKPGYCVSRCGDYISDENPTACAIM